MPVCTFDVLSCNPYLALNCHWLIRVQGEELTHRSIVQRRFSDSYIFISIKLLRIRTSHVKVNLGFLAFSWLFKTSVNCFFFGSLRRTAILLAIVLAQVLL